MNEPGNDKKRYALSCIVSEACNLRCKFCYQESFSAKRISDDILYNKLKPFYEHAVYYDLLGGELTILPGMKEYVRFLCENYPGMRIAISTNGVLFDEEWRRMGVEFDGLHFNFSLNGVSADSFDWFLPAADSRRVHRMVHDNFNRALETQNATGKKIFNAVSMVVTEQSQNHIEEFALFALERGVNVRFLLSLQDAASDEARLALDNRILKLAFFYEEYIDIVIRYSHAFRDMKERRRHISENCGEEKEKHLAALSFQPRKSMEKALHYDDFFPDDGTGCPLLGNSLAIRTDGRVTPCPLLPNYTLGYMEWDSVEDVMSSDDYRNLAAMVHARNYRYCPSRCSLVKDPATCLPNQSYVPERYRNIV